MRVSHVALALALIGALPAVLPAPATAEDKVVATINGKPITDADLAVADSEIGGDMGSTAGGIKILRWLVLIRLLRLLFARTAVPRHAVIEPYVAGRRLNDVELEAAIGIVTAYALAALLSWLPFLLCGVDPLAALFEVVSALSTCGLSAGVAGPELHPLLKIVLCADMLMGRVEVMAFLILIYPRTWWGRTTEEA
jgi:trk system potassium uptake protein TrkH